MIILSTQTNFNTCLRVPNMYDYITLIAPFILLIGNKRYVLETGFEPIQKD